MKRIFFYLQLFILTTIVLLFLGCQKTKNSSQFFSEKNLQIVPDSVALEVALKFNPSVFFSENNSTNHYPIKTRLTGNNKIKERFKFNDSNGTPALYIFNFENHAGFLFVSADYQLQPILGFIQQGEFIKDTVPSGIIQWVEKTMENIEIVRKGLYDNSKIANAAWKNYLNSSSISSNTQRVAPSPSNPCNPPPPPQTVTIGPLLPVTWGQACTYNTLCPNINCSIGCGTGNAWTGCVATSTAQIINFWHPFSGYAYDYASMPTTSGNVEVQRLMRDIGLPVNVNMNYGCDGSGANGSKVPNSLKSNFGFTSANFSDYNYQKVQSNLNSQWPVLLDGCRTESGHWFIINWWNSYSDCHEWVCDGYQQTTYTFCNNGSYEGAATYLYFHMNWGWHEAWGGNDYNGWFAFDNWNISELNRNYQYAQDITSEIHP